jgi:hypothetical protein
MITSCVWLHRRRSRGYPDPDSLDSIIFPSLRNTAYYWSLLQCVICQLCIHERIDCCKASVPTKTLLTDCRCKLFHRRSHVS